MAGRTAVAYIAELKRQYEQEMGTERNWDDYASEQGDDHIGDPVTVNETVWKPEPEPEPVKPEPKTTGLSVAEQLAAAEEELKQLNEKSRQMFQNLFSQKGKKDEYKKALQEYNSLKDQKEELEKQIEAYRKQLK